MKCSVAVGKIMPVAIYGCPCSPSAPSDMKRLRAHLTTMLDRRAASNRAPDLALNLAEKCIDPRVRVLVAR
eukprot:10957413-Alexandrium_andersonii.AAC.1